MTAAAPEAQDPRPLADARWLIAPESRRILELLTHDGGAARFVGGCVRDTLLDPALDPADLDLATPLPPDIVTERLRRAGVRVAPTGIAHGTVTAWLGRHSYEITTLRQDVQTDGRHAVVAFTADFDADAARRDFTINAMSCDGEGRLFDPFGGRADLLAGRIRFVGEPLERIREDYLRILRFFRFYARFGRPPADEAALAACAALASGLDRLSPERVRQELLGLLAMPRPTEALRLMVATGVLGRVLPVPADIERLERLVRLWPSSDPLLRLAALIRPPLPDAAAAEGVALALRLPLADTRRLVLLCGTPLPRLDAHRRGRLHALYRHGRELYTDLLALAAAETGDGARHAAALAEVARLAPPRFPLGGADVLARGVPRGPEVGRLLEEVRAWWEAGGFSADRAACLARLDALLAPPGNLTKG